ncbi:MAG: TonB-dependent receptor [Proteobacteria bacterium]|nr:TonB-dependent receptor [Pseudomonadota bacterium]
MLTGVAAPALAADSGIETIVVTAEKRVEDLQKTPISIQALPAERLAQLNITNFNDYVRYLPSVTYTSGFAGAGNGGPGFANVSMRGVSSGNDGNHSGSLPTVGIYLDEQPITTIGGALDIHVYDIERVESLSGPQGTLYGASSEAGTIRIITNKPDFSGTYGGYDFGADTVSHGGVGYEAEGFLNAPISDKVAIRLVAYAQHDAGYIDNVPGSLTFPTSGITVNNSAVVKNNFNTSDTYGGRFALTYNIDNNWTIMPTVIAQSTNSNGIFATNVTLGDLKVQQYFPDYSHDRWVQAALTIQGKIADLDVVYSGGYMDRTINAASDYTDYSYAYDTLYGYGVYFYDNHGNLIDPQQYIYEKDRFTKLSQELRVSSSQDDRFRWVAGLFFEQQRHEILQNYTVAGLADENADVGVGQVSVPGWSGTLWLTDQHREDNDLAAFSEVSFDVTPSFTLTAGGRVFYAANSLKGFFGFSSAYSSHTGVAICTGPAVVAGTPCTDVNKAVYESGFTHRLNATWHIDDDRMVYATWSTGFRPGGVNRRGTIPPYQPDRLTNYEIGAKTAWLDNTVHFNIAAYIEDWNRFQFSFLGLNSFTEIHNAGNARIYGAEADLVIQPMDGLTISGALTLTDAHLTTDYCGPVVGGVIITQCPGPVDPWTPDAPKGTELPGTPKVKTNWTARYEFPVMGFVGHVQGGVVYQSGMWGDLRIQAANPVFGELSMPVPVRSVVGRFHAFATADFTTGIESDHWAVDLAVSNLFDERGGLGNYALCTIQSCEGVLYGSVTQPRTVSIKFSHKLD